MMINVSRFAAAFVGVALCSPAWATTPLTDNTRDIEQVMQAFHQAVVTHDGASLETLFLSDARLVNALDDERFATEKQKSPDARKLHVSSAHDFAQFVSSTRQPLDPVHSNVRVLSDGVVATVYFDFVFNIDGKPQNTGDETWQLVKDADGWRIASIVFSSKKTHALALISFICAKGRSRTPTSGPCDAHMTEIRTLLVCDALDGVRDACLGGFSGRSSRPEA